VAVAARRLGLARQSVQRVVDDLAAGGFVVLRPNPDHARAALVELTPAGRDALDALTRRSDATRRRMLEKADISAADLQRAGAVLQRLVAALGTDSGG